MADGSQPSARQQRHYYGTTTRLLRPARIGVGRDCSHWRAELENAAVGGRRVVGGGNRERAGDPVDEGAIAREGRVVGVDQGGTCRPAAVRLRRSRSKSTTLFVTSTCCWSSAARSTIVSSSLAQRSRSSATATQSMCPLGQQAGDARGVHLVEQQRIGSAGGTGFPSPRGHPPSNWCSRVSVIT